VPVRNPGDRRRARGRGEGPSRGGSTHGERGRSDVSGGRNPLSLAAWSLHQAFEAGEIDQIGMVRLAGKLGFAGFELLNTFFPAPTEVYLQELRAVARDAGTELVRIMCED